MNRGEYQRNILAWLLKEEDAMELAAGRIRLEHFEDEYLRLVFRLAMKSWEKMQRVPTEQEMLVYLDQALESRGPLVMEAGRKKTRQVYATEIRVTGVQVREWTAYQEIRHACLKCLDRPVDEVEEAAAHLRDRLDRIDPLLAKGSRIDAFTEDTFDEKWWDDITGPIMPTGYPTIDACIRGGGMHNGEQITILATPEKGKTMVLVDMAVRMAEHGRVLFFSLDNTRAEIGRRVASRMSGVSLEEEVSRDELARGIRAWHEKVGATKEEGRFILLIRTPHVTSLADLRRDIRVVIKRFGTPRAFFVDYGDQVVPGKKYGTRREELGNVFRGIKGIARDTGMVSVVATQGNRLALGARILTMAHMSECHDKNFESNLTLALCQTEQEAASHPPKMRIAIAKNTKGTKKNQVLPFRTDFAHATIREDHSREVYCVGEEGDGGQKVMVRKRTERQERWAQIIDPPKTD